jgi:hypothetical protein
MMLYVALVGYDGKTYVGSKDEECFDSFQVLYRWSG